MDEFYPAAEKIVLVMNNPNPHKQDSWLNTAETERSVLSRQGLDRRIDNQAELSGEVAAWERGRNEAEATVEWRFTTTDARIGLKRLYPSIRPC